jgi:hypothetical protein
MFQVSKGFPVGSKPFDYNIWIEDTKKFLLESIDPSRVYNEEEKEEMEFQALWKALAKQAPGR